MAEFKLEICKRNDNKVQAIWAEFLNANMKPETVESMSYRCFEKPSKDRRAIQPQRLLVAESERMTYVGKSPDPSFSEDSSRPVILVRNKETNKVRILPNTARFFVKPVFPEQDDEEVESVKNKQQQYDYLTSKFAGAKNKRKMEERLRNTLSEEALKQAVGKTVDEVDTSILEGPHKEPNTNSEYIPPYNADAEKPEDVYNLNDICPQYCRITLETMAKQIVESNREVLESWRSLNTFPTFILDQIEHLPMETAARTHKALILCFLHCMITLYRKNSKEVRCKNASLPKDFPAKVIHYLLDNFTLMVDGASGKNRTFPKRLKERLLGHILALCLILEQFEVRLSALMSDLKIGERLAMDTFRALGCKVGKRVKKQLDGSKHTEKVATLSLPLTFPSLDGSKQRGRKK